MIRKYFSTFAAAALLALTAFLTPTEAQAQRRPFRSIRVHYSGNLPQVRIYINGRYKGMVGRGSWSDYRMRTGFNYRIQATYAGRSDVKTIYLSRSSRRPVHNVRFTAPNRAGRDDHGMRPGRRARMEIAYRGSKPYARLFIDGQAQGQVRRNSTRVFNVQTGRRYTIRMTFAGRSVTKSVHISRHDRMERVVFYAP
jgi:hypothetical protein